MKPAARVVGVIVRGPSPPSWRPRVMELAFKARGARARMNQVVVPFDADTVL